MWSGAERRKGYNTARWAHLPPRRWLRLWVSQRGVHTRFIGVPSPRDASSQPSPPVLHLLLVYLIILSESWFQHLPSTQSLLATLLSIANISIASLNPIETPNNWLTQDLFYYPPDCYVFTFPLVQATHESSYNHTAWNYSNAHKPPSLRSRTVKTSSHGEPSHLSFLWRASLPLTTQ